ncbi:MAG TPA: carboxypeptidase regulatory-like domain-containing protein [Pyrinomonadaceae bacterium]|nr:carboxypeptidase regulatory-like domain-containing protein [Pyrinomonadaceae bacterium]
MISSTFKAAGCLLFAISISVYAQNPVKKPATSTISGKVTSKGAGVAGIVVGARERESTGQEKPALVATTDSQGGYRISNVPPGTYEIVPASTQFVLVGSDSHKRLIVGEGETVEGIDFAVVRGGVITGRVTDTEGRPVIEENVHITGWVENRSRAFTRGSSFSSSTDDRGVYRVYGLPPGKYRVSAGISDEEFHPGRPGQPSHQQTFHPATADETKATLVEVTEGGETTNVDITLRRSRATFTVSGKIVDADTGKPVPDAVYGLQKFRENGSTASSGMVTNKQGEFRFNNVTPGKYSVFLDRSDSGDVYVEPVQFEVTDQDVSGLVLKASAGSTISGVVIVEGMDEKAGRGSTRGMYILAQYQDEQGRFDDHRPSHDTINADGSFRLRGVRPGVVEFLVFDGRSGETRGAEVTRLEGNGVVETRNLRIKDREQISDLRVFVKYHRGSIRGVVKIENGESSLSDRVYVTVAQGADQSSMTSVPVDARGRFFLAGLKPGVYEITAVANVPGAGNKRPRVKQQAVVVDNQVSEVTLTLDVKPKQ